MNCYRVLQIANCNTLYVVDSMVARDGVEPPTPAFSGLNSTEVKPLNPNLLTKKGALNRGAYCHSNVTALDLPQKCAVSDWTHGELRA